MTYDEHFALLRTAIKVGGLDETLEMVAGVLAQKDTEIDVLRRYGNKNCTAMADAALQEKRDTGKFPFED